MQERRSRTKRRRKRRIDDEDEDAALPRLGGRPLNDESPSACDPSLFLAKRGGRTRTSTWARRSLLEPRISSRIRIPPGQKQQQGQRRRQCCSC